MKPTISILILLVASAAHAQTIERVELGRLLFFDKRLSVDNSTSCATCHDIANRGGADGRALAVGLGRFVGTRNTPTVVNAAAQRKQFWDMRSVSLRDQSVLPLLNPLEMSNNSNQQVIDRLRRIAGYRQMFAAAGYEGIAIANVRDALVAFEKTLVASDTPARHYLAGEREAVGEQAARGLEAMKSLQCFECHQPANYFRDGRVHNQGLSARSGGKDQGRVAITKDGDNAKTRAFKTPTLIGIRRTAPYGHDGSLLSLGDVVAHYGSGGSFRVGGGKPQVDPLIDPRVKAMRFNGQIRKDIVAALDEAFDPTDWPIVYPPKEFPQ